MIFLWYFICYNDYRSVQYPIQHIFCYRCSACDSLFPSLMALEHHKEEFEHWSGDEDVCTESEDEDDDTVAGEEHVRLL